MSDVHFCNLCDQSVPLVEIEEGQARRVGDRVLCHTCRTLLSASISRRGGGGGLGWLALVLALVALAGAGFVWIEGGRADRDLTRSLGASVERLETRLGELDESLQTAARDAGEERALLARSTDALRESQEASSSAFEARLADVKAGVEEFGRYFADQESLIRRLDQLETTVSVVEDRLRGYRADLVALRDEVDRQRDLLAASAAAAESSGGALAEFSPEVSGLLQQLQDDDQNIRYNALERLQPLQDLRLLPHLYPALSDPYEFNRFLAAHILGDWNARPAAPHLIETLNDEVPFVREAAVNALRRLTAQNFGFDPRGSPEARKRAYQSWRAWWEANSEEFLAGG